MRWVVGLVFLLAAIAADTPGLAEEDSVFDRGFRTLDDQGFRQLKATWDDWIPPKFHNDGEKNGNWKFRKEIITKEATTFGYRIATAESFENIAFTFDLRRLPDSKTIRFYPRGTRETLISIAPSNDKFGRFLFDVGEWNRFEGEIRGKILSLIVNGKKLSLIKLEDIDHQVPDIGNDFIFRIKKNPTPPQKGPLAFFADGPVEITNVYVRELVKAR